MNRKASLLVSVNIGLLAAASPALAQVGAPSLAIQEIVVTAQKRVQSINDVGLTVTAIGGDALRMRGVTSLADIAAQVPGLSFSNSASNTPVYTLRGVGFYETTLGAYPDVSSYIDEAPLPFPVLAALTAFDLERIEVLKGPQGTLFGNNATGGSINYIVAKPTDELEAGIQLGYGRFNTFVGEGYVSGPVTDGLKARVAGRVERASGWQRGYTFDGKTAETRQYAGRLLLDWEASERLRVQVNFNGWKDEGEPQALQYIAIRQGTPGAPNPVEGYPVAPQNPRAADFTADIDPYLNNRLYQGVLRVDYDVSDGIALTSLTSYVDYNQDMAYDGDGVTINNFDFPEFLGDITAFSQELRLTNSGADRLRWVIGGNYSEDEATDFYETLYRHSTVGTAFGLTHSTFGSSQKMKNYAAFANAEYDIAKFTVKGGLRFTQADRKATSCFAGAEDDAAAFSATYGFIANLLRGQNGLDPVPPPVGTDCLSIDNTGLEGAPPTFLSTEFRGTLKEDSVSWRVGVDWKPTDDILLYANLAKGYKSGSFPSAAAGTTAQLLPVTQESILSYEAGFKATLLSGQAQVNGAAFYYDYKNKQLRSKLVDPVFGVLDALVNVPKSSVKGAELEASARPMENLSVYASGVYLDAKVDRFVGFNGEGVLGDFAGFSVPYSPKYQFSAGAELSHPITENLHAFGGADFNYRSKAIAVIGGSDGYRIDSYVTIDLRTGIEDADGRWRFQLWAKNITNEHYWTNVTSFYDTLARYTGRPATYGATFSYRYN